MEGGSQDNNQPSIHRDKNTDREEEDSPKEKADGNNNFKFDVDEEEEDKNDKDEAALKRQISISDDKLNGRRISFDFDNP